MKLEISPERRRRRARNPGCSLAFNPPCGGNGNDKHLAKLRICSELEAKVSSWRRKVTNVKQAFVTFNHEYANNCFYNVAAASSASSAGSDASAAPKFKGKQMTLAPNRDVEENYYTRLATPPEMSRRSSMLAALGVGIALRFRSSSFARTFASSSTTRG